MSDLWEDIEKDAKITPKAKAKARRRRRSAFVKLLDSITVTNPPWLHLQEILRQHDALRRNKEFVLFMFDDCILFHRAK